MPTITDVLLTIALNAGPILLLFVPYFFGRKKLWGKIYLRFYIGLAVYFLVYMVLPSIFQFDRVTTNTALSELTTTPPADAGDQALEFYAWRNVSTIALYLQYPVYQISIIFILAPLISVLLLWNRLRKEEGTSQEKLENLVFEMKQSPKDQIKSGLMAGSWQTERDLLKLFVILLPISLYLLSVIINITTTQGMSENFLNENSPLGWFLEIFFVYLASLLMGVHLLSASRVSFKGRFIGDAVQEKTFDSLTTVGAPISILSIVLFVVNYQESLLVVLYFFAYFLMAAVIFVCYLKIFIPISILIFIKIVDWWKKKKAQPAQKSKSSSLPSVLAALVGTGAVLGWVFLFDYQLLGSIINPETGWVDPSPSVAYSLFQASQAEMAIFINSMEQIGIVLILGAFMYAGNRGKRNVGVTTLTFVGILYAVSIVIQMVIPAFLNAPVFQVPLRLANVDSWISNTPAWTNALGFEFYTMRTVFFESQFQNFLLIGLAYPYVFLYTASGVVLWGLLFYYTGKKFTFQSIRDEGVIHKVAFSSYHGLPLKSELQQNPTEFNFSTQEDLAGDLRVPEDLRALLRKSASLAAIMDSLALKFEDAYALLKPLVLAGAVQAWVPEFSYSFKEAKLSTLHIMYSDGRDVFSYQFPGGSMESDPALVSGMFSAITSFIKETTKSSELLRTIDHGDVKLIIEYGEYIFGAIFADMETTDVRAKLKDFIGRFEHEHARILPNWTGNIDPFAEDTALVEDIFEIE